MLGGAMTGSCLFARGKSKQTIIIAIARELSAFIWAIDHELQQNPTG